MQIIFTFFQESDSIAEQIKIEYSDSGSEDCRNSPFSSLKRSNDEPNETVKKINAPITAISQQVIDLIGNRASSYQKEDEFDVFGKSIAFNMRKIPQDKVPYAQKLINDVMFLALTDELTVNTCIFNKR